MKATIECKEFREAIAAVSELVSEVNIEAKEEGLEIIAMDPANVAMVIFKMPSSEMLAYEGGEKFCINIDNFSKILKRVKERITLEVVDNRLHISSSNGISKKFEMPLISNEEDAKKVPELKLNAGIEMKTADFINALEDANIVAEAVVFEFDNNEGSIMAEDMSKMKQNLVGTVTTKEKAKGKYSLEYLNKMGSKGFETVKIGMATDYPMRIDYKGKVELSFILAPRVEN